MAIPDWKNPGDYTYAKSLSWAGWAWEFLRRSERYRKAYSAYTARVAGLEAEFGISWRSNPKSRAPYPVRLEGESRNAWMYRCDMEGIKPRHLWVDQIMGREFSMLSMYDPDEIYSKDIDFFEPAPFPLLASRLDELGPYSKHNDDTERDEIDDEIAVIAFSLSSGLQRQLDVARRLLKAAGTHRGVGKSRGLTKDDQTWSTYLRVLDAQIAGASIEETANVLFAHLASSLETDDYAREQRKQARKWQTSARQNKLLSLHFA